MGDGLTNSLRSMEPPDPPPPFDCPRCGAATEAPFYGPCPSCRAALVESQVGTTRSADVGRFEPSMNVVPNQVATKD